jgi:hypothetical protein
VVDLNDDEYGSTDEEDPGQFPFSFTFVVIHGPKRIRFIHYVETQLQFTIGHANLCKLQAENTETQNVHA